MKKNVIFILMGLIVVFSCKDQKKNRNKVRLLGEYSVKSVFYNDSIPDGASEYYDKTGKLVSVINFDRGVRNGLAVNYYPDSHLKDSLFFVADKEVGYWYHFDSLGNILFIDNYYYGIPVGPRFFYKDGQLSRYSFIDFNRIVIAEGLYDNSENLIDVPLFRMNPVIFSAYKDAVKIQSLFAYLPRLEGANQIFFLGTVDKNGIEKDARELRSSGYYIDTILPILPAGEHYYISCRIRNKSEQINRIYIERFDD